MAEQDLINKTEAIELGINQVEYSNTPDGPVVHIFGRTPDGTYAEVRVTGFKPYFYAGSSLTPWLHFDFTRYSRICSHNGYVC